MRPGHVLALAVALALCACGPARPEPRPSMRLQDQHPEKDDDPATPAPTLDLPGVDVSSLTARERTVLAKVVRELTSPCGDPASLETCVNERRACKRCLPAAQLAVKLVAHGDDSKTTRAWLSNRFDDAAVKSIDLAYSPTTGPTQAPLVVVEFADFECPHCAAAAPLVHAAIDADGIKGKALLAFKNFPLNHHVHAEPAARAALAAQLQGKFWDMHDQIFAHQDSLEVADLEAFAKTIGLDVKKWQSDMTSPLIVGRVVADHAMGEKVGVDATPTVFVNGRKFVPALKDFAGELKSWMLLDLQLMGP